MAKQTKTNFEIEDLKYMQKTGRGIMAPDGETQAKRDYPNLFKDGLVYYDGFSKAIKLTEKGKRPIMSKVIITVQKAGKKYGFELRHNQQPGFKGIIGNTFGWYRYKSDAIQRAQELEKCWNHV